MSQGQPTMDAAIDYPAMITPVNHVEAVPRRIRAFIAAQPVFDTTRARYVWERREYPQYYIPISDVRGDALVRETEGEPTPRGVLERYGVRAGDVYRPGAAQLVVDSPLPSLEQTVRFDWSALDGWFEEDEQVFVHPRNPYVRVDALRSTRRVRVELDGATLAESSSPVMLFETGLPTRYYFNRLDINWAHLVPTATGTECPYKGRTTGYWSARVGERVHPDIAWSYDFPTRQVSPIAGLVAFYNERVDIVLEGERLEPPRTGLSRRAH